MNARELQDRLIAEGCKYFIIRPWSDREGVFASEYMGVEVLECINGIWTIYFTERGSNRSPDFESSSEAEACEVYYKIVTSRPHNHNVGVFEDRNKAISLQKEMEKINIESKIGVGPPLRDGGKKLHSVSVEGTDIFKVRELYADLPLKDYD